MPLDLQTYDVAIARDGLDLDRAIEAGEGDGYTMQRVTVLHPDQIVAEQTAPRYGIAGMDSENAPKMTWVTLWVWAALRRTETGVPEFPLFKTRVLDLSPVAAPEPLDPTPPAPDTGSP